MELWKDVAMLLINKAEVNEFLTARTKVLSAIDFASINGESSSELVKILDVLNSICFAN